MEIIRDFDTYGINNKRGIDTYTTGDYIVPHIPAG